MFGLKLNLKKLHKNCKYLSGKLTKVAGLCFENNGSRNSDNFEDGAQLFAICKLSAVKKQKNEKAP